MAPWPSCREFDDRRIHQLKMRWPLGQIKMNSRPYLTGTWAWQSHQTTWYVLGWFNNFNSLTKFQEEQCGFSIKENPSHGLIDRNPPPETDINALQRKTIMDSKPSEPSEPPERVYEHVVPRQDQLDSNYKSDTLVNGQRSRKRPNDGAQREDIHHFKRLRVGTAANIYDISLH